jgi:hypothetical protein
MLMRLLSLLFAPVAVLRATRSLDAVRYSRSPSAVLADMAKGKKHGVGSGYNMLGPGDAFGEIAFFTEVPQLEVSLGGGGQVAWLAAGSWPFSGRLLCYLGGSLVLTLSDSAR